MKANCPMCYGAGASKKGRVCSFCGGSGKAVKPAPTEFLDSVYMLVDKRGCVMYSAPAFTAKECWENYEKAVDENGDFIYGTGADSKHLRKMGYRAIRVMICR